jgi:hypothetical protein
MSVEECQIILHFRPDIRTVKKAPADLLLKIKDGPGCSVCTAGGCQQDAAIKEDLHAPR